MLLDRTGKTMEGQENRVTVTLGGSPEPGDGVSFEFKDGRKGIWPLGDPCHADAKAKRDEWNARPHRPLTAGSGALVMATLEVDEADALRGVAYRDALIQAMRSKR